MDDATTWELIHRERSSVADLLAELSADQWAERSLVGAWSVHAAAAHILAGAEQTTPHFVGRFAASGFRFNAMIDHDVRRLSALSPAEIIARLRSRTTTTNRPPAPVTTMLGEVVVHGEDIRRPLGVAGDPPPEAVAACLEMYANSNFPVGTKGRIEGLHLVASDVGWSHGAGPDVTGPGLAMLVAITGRGQAAGDLAGEGAATLQARMPAPAG